jgi:hypothetical protein
MDPIPDQGSRSDIYLSTPLTVIGIFVAILQERFAPATPSDPPLKWNWTSDVKETGIIIASGFNKNIEARNARPAIWVDREQTTYGEISIGNRDQIPISLRTRHQQYYAMAEMDIVMDCTSKNRGESMMVGSVVQDFLQMSAREIMRFFGFRDITPIILNRTVPYEKDRELMSTSVQFRVAYEARWASIPIYPVLHAIKMRLGDADDPDTYFREVALRDN